MVVRPTASGTFKALFGCFDDVPCWVLKSGTAACFSTSYTVVMWQSSLVGSGSICTTTIITMLKRLSKIQNSSPLRKKARKVVYQYGDEQPHSNNYVTMNSIGQIIAFDRGCQGSDTRIRTQKPGGFFGYTRLKTRQKPTLNLIALYSLITCFAILKF